MNSEQSGDTSESESNADGLNPLDVVYEIVTELSKNTLAAEGWVDVEDICTGARAVYGEVNVKARFGSENVKSLVSEALDNWESLGIMVNRQCSFSRNGQVIHKSIVKFREAYLRDTPEGRALAKPIWK